MHDKSVFHYEEALKLSPRDLTIRLNLARAYVQAGSLQKARDSYLELLKLDPVAWEAMFELGKTYVSLGDSANAKKIFSDLIAKKPDFGSRAEVDRILAGL
jgi:tetratricopeptide (TPR) repeat protein